MTEGRDIESLVREGLVQESLGPETLVLDAMENPMMGLDRFRWRIPQENVDLEKGVSQNLEDADETTDLKILSHSS